MHILSYPNVAELVSISDVNTQLKITKVLHSIPSSISEEMTSVFKDILDRYCSNSKMRKSPWMLSIPQNVSVARSTYMMVSWTYSEYVQLITLIS